MTLRLAGSTSGYTEIDAPAVAGSNTLVLPTGNGSNGQVLTTNGSGVLSWGGAGKILQMVEASTTSFASTATSIPFDDTIPQNTEGAEAVTVSITPTSSTNKLYIFANIPSITASAGAFTSCALFQDSTANALSTSTMYCPAINYIYTQQLTHFMTAGTTSSTTFKLRYGAAGATAYINGVHSGRVFGGTSTLRLIVMEVAA